MNYCAVHLYVVALGTCLKPLLNLNSEPLDAHKRVLEDVILR